jgi:two-component system response regulator
VLQTVLVVDDDIDELHITRTVLSKASRGIRVLAFTRAEAALDALSREDCLPSLIFLDLKLPGMSGIDALKFIRSDTRLKNIPVVVCTNSKLESDTRAAIDAGASNFLQKAFDIEQFTNDINNLLDCWIKKD